MYNRRKYIVNTPKGPVAVSQQQYQSLVNYQRTTTANQTMRRNQEMERARKEQLAKAPKVLRGLYLELEITNSSTAEQEVVLFDALGAYAAQQNYSKPGSISIVGVSKNYQLIINKLVAGKFILHDLHLETKEDKLTQFARPLSFWDDTMAVNNVSISKTLFPNQGRNSMQRQLNLQEIDGLDKIIDGSTAFVTNVLGGNTYILRLFLEEIRFS